MKRRDYTWVTSQVVEVSISPFKCFGNVAKQMESHRPPTRVLNCDVTCEWPQYQKSLKTIRNVVWRSWWHEHNWERSDMWKSIVPSTFQHALREHKMKDFTFLFCCIKLLRLFVFRSRVEQSLRFFSLLIVPPAICLKLGKEYKISHTTSTHRARKGSK